MEEGREGEERKKKTGFLLVSILPSFKICSNGMSKQRYCTRDRQLQILRQRSAWLNSEVGGEEEGKEGERKVKEVGRRSENESLRRNVERTSSRAR